MAGTAVKESKKGKFLRGVAFTNRRVGMNESGGGACYGVGSLQQAIFDRVPTALIYARLRGFGMRRWVEGRGVPEGSLDT